MGVKHDFSCLLLSLCIFQCYSFAISMEDNGIVKLKWSLPIFTYFSSFALAALIHNAYGQRDDSFYCHATVGITATKITSKCKFWLLFSSVCSAYVVDVKKNCGHSTLLATIRVCYKQNANTYLPMPIPSASSKIFWPCSNFFDCVQYFLNKFKIFWPWPKVIFYLINLHIWSWSKIFDHIQIYWTRSKNFERSQFCFWTSRWIRHYT